MAGQSAREAEERRARRREAEAKAAEAWHEDLVGKLRIRTPTQKLTTNFVVVDKDGGHASAYRTSCTVVPGELRAAQRGVADGQLVHAAPP